MHRFTYLSSLPARAEPGFYFDFSFFRTSLFHLVVIHHSCTGGPRGTRAASLSLVFALGQANKDATTATLYLNTHTPQSSTRLPARASIPSSVAFDVKVIKHDAGEVVEHALENALTRLTANRSRRPSSAFRSVASHPLLCTSAGQSSIWTI